TEISKLKLSQIIRLIRQLSDKRTSLILNASVLAKIRRYQPFLNPDCHLNLFITADIILKS
ncbi:hypothetical protein, partial [Methylotenera sp.]|uniref:hypothetical protein n=1 Tax=Methylotenera sp. TaxID=2051956 RepID=UPI00272FA7D0